MEAELNVLSNYPYNLKENEIIEINVKCAKTSQKNHSVNLCKHII